VGDTIDQPISKTQGWLKIFRISNAPTVISNITVGVALAYQVDKSSSTPSYEFGLVPLFVISGVLLLIYFAGMIFNDASDTNYDRQHRPDRPIPMGIISSKEAWLLGSVMLAVALFASSIALNGENVSTQILVATVVAYTFLHRWFIPAIVLMGICRGLVYLVALSAFSIDTVPEQLILLCISIALYTAILTFIGRSEHENRAKHAWIVWSLLLPALVPALMHTSGTFDLVWIMLIVYLGWLYLAWRDFTFERSQTTAGMHKLLSGFCLLDCVLIASLGEYVLLIVPVVCFFLTVVLHRSIKGT